MAKKKQKNFQILHIAIVLIIVMAVSFFAGAFAAAPNPGHTIGQIECSNTFCAKSGGVGIGTTNAVRKLHINEPSKTATYMQITHSTTGSASNDGLLIGIDANKDARMTNYEGKDIFFIVGGAERFRFASNGRLGIGTTSPAQALHVVGNIQA